MKTTTAYFWKICLELMLVLGEAKMQYDGALQESFLINLKSIKNECDAHTASLLAVIEDLQQNVNTTLIRDLKAETRSIKKIVQDFNLTVKDQQETDDQFNKTVQEHQKSILQMNKNVEEQQRRIKQQNRTDEEQQGEIVELTKSVKEHQRAILQSYTLVDDFNRTIKDQRNSIQQLKSKIDLLNKTDVSDLKKQVEALESILDDQRQMIQRLNDSHRSGTYHVIMIKHKHKTHTS